MLPPAADKPLRPVGEWNESRVLVRGDHVELQDHGDEVAFGNIRIPVPAR